MNSKLIFYAYNNDVLSFTPLSLTVFLIFCWLVLKLFKRKNRLIKTLFIGYVILLISATGVLNIDTTNIKLTNAHTQLHIGLFYDYFNTLIVKYHFQALTYKFVQFILINLFLLTPLGYFFPVLFNQTKLIKVILIGFCVSLSIEIIQLVEHLFNLNSRQFDVDDLLLNTIGVIIGYIILYKILTPKKKGRS